jgi:nitrite reductase/ring-hydroxylating ferredoxin subunit
MRPPNRLTTDRTGSVGNASALSIGAMLVMSNVVLARDANGVYAISAVCTHAGCLLDDSSSTPARGLYCPYHGSAFDGNGSVTNGPARSPLFTTGALCGDHRCGRQQHRRRWPDSVGERSGPARLVNGARKLTCRRPRRSCVTRKRTILAALIHAAGVARLLITPRRCHELNQERP